MLLLYRMLLNSIRNIVILLLNIHYVQAFSFKTIVLRSVYADGLVGGCVSGKVHDVASNRESYIKSRVLLTVHLDIIV